jgi:hypothetical protein
MNPIMMEIEVEGLASLESLGAGVARLRWASDD